MEHTRTEGLVPMLYRRTGPARRYVARRDADGRRVDLRQIPTDLVESVED
ncbi:MAG: hypothetical protein WBA12_03585 [Catalinimonas sp.]